MSKIAEKKAEERFPLRKIDNGGTEAYYNAGQLNHRRVYIEAYDQAVQDFLEKAVKWLKENTFDYCWINHMGNSVNISSEFYEDFIKVMKK